MKIRFADDPMSFLRSEEEDDVGCPVAVRPCDPECEGKTFLGFMLGSLPHGRYIVSEDFEDDEESGERTKIGISVITSRNPAMYVPALRRIVWGSGSWWSRIESEEKLREITDESIQNLWYVKALNHLTEEK